jgi:hypothetical protein
LETTAHDVIANIAMAIAIVLRIIWAIVCAVI